jgi:cysteine synthase A
VRGCHYLLEQEAVLAGGSSGGVVEAVRNYAACLPDRANIVLVLPDRGERYLDTIFNDDWVERNSLREATEDAIVD